MKKEITEANSNPPQEEITEVLLSMIRRLSALMIIPVLTLLGASLRIEAEENSVKVGVFRDSSLWAFLYCQGTPVDYLEDTQSLLHKPYDLLLVSASDIESLKDLQSLVEYSSKNPLFLFGWGPLVDSLPEEERKLWEELSSTLGLRNLRWVSQGRRWVHLREERLSPRPGFQTVLDLGEGPSFSAELQEGVQILAEWVTAQGTEVEKERSACLIRHDKHLWLAFDPKIRGENLEVLGNLLLQTLRYSLPRMKSRNFPEKQNSPLVKGPPKERILALPWEVLSSFKDYPPPSSLSPLWNGIALELARAGNSLYPSNYQIIAPESWGKLADWLTHLKAEGLRLYLLFPLLIAGEKRLQGPLLRYKPDWGLAFPPSSEQYWFNPSLPAFREWSRKALAEILQSFSWDGVLITNWIPPGEKETEYLASSRLLVTELCSVIQRVRRGLVIGLEDNGSRGRGLPIDFYFHPQSPKEAPPLFLISLQANPYWWLEPNRWKLEEHPLGFLLWWPLKLPVQLMSLPGPPEQGKIARSPLQDPLTTALYYCGQALLSVKSSQLEKALLGLNLALSSQEQERRISLLKQSQSLLAQALSRIKGEIQRKISLTIGLISLQVRNEAPIPLPDACPEPEAGPSRQ